MYIVTLFRKNTIILRQFFSTKKDANIYKKNIHDAYKKDKYYKIKMQKEK